jgi:hypothetical protein
MDAIKIRKFGRDGLDLVNASVQGPQHLSVKWRICGMLNPVQLPQPVNGVLSARDHAACPFYDRKLALGNFSNILELFTCFGSSLGASFMPPFPFAMMGACSGQGSNE